MPRAGTLRNLHVHARVAGSAGQTLKYTVRKNGADTLLLTSQASNAADSSDFVDTVAVVTGDLVSLKVSRTGAPFIVSSPTDVIASVEYDSP